MANSVTLTLTVVFGTPNITTTSLPQATVGVAYSFQMEATGGSGTYAWSITAGTLPAGLSMSAGGLISGTPTAAVSDTLTFLVANA